MGWRLQLQALVAVLLSLARPIEGRAPLDNHVSADVGLSDDDDHELPPGLLPIPGEPGIDYPLLSDIPKTDFHCQLVQPGFYADINTECQVWHYCDMEGRQQSFLCPNGTLFNQVVLVCDWWYNVDCAYAPKAYLINTGLYKPNPPRLKKLIF